MSSPETNRQNAQHSTGPRTETGKQTSAQNARKHGLSSATLYVPPEAQEEFQQLHHDLKAEIRPTGELQHQLYEQLLHASWQQTIARRMLTQAQYAGDEKRTATAHRYIRQYEASFARALRQLKELQTNQALRALPQNEPIRHLPAPCNTQTLSRQVTKQAPKQSENPNPPEATQRPNPQNNPLAA